MKSSCRRRAEQWVLAPWMLLIACTGITHEEKQLEFREAAIGNDVLGVSERCNLENTEVYSYRTPSGREMSIRAASQPVFTLLLDESVSVTFVDWGEIEEGQGRAVVANVVPRAQELQEANRARQAVFTCDLLLTIDGHPVDIERQGRNWVEWIPGGTFASISEAERAYSGSSARISSEIAPESERKAQQDFWKWRWERNLWEFHCDAWTREYVRSRDPKIYEALEQTARPDCEHPPEYEEPAR